MHNIITIRIRKFRPIRYRKKRKTWTRSKWKWKKILCNNVGTTKKKGRIKKEKELEKKIKK